VDDGRTFWQHIVTSSTGCSDAQYFEELYQYFMTEKVTFNCEVSKRTFFVVSDFNWTDEKLIMLGRPGSFVTPMPKVYLKL
jgi:hypothetical protein